MPSGLEVYAQDGRKRIGTDSISALLIGELSVGGAGSAKTGSVSDSRLALGTPFFVVVSYPFADREGNGPVFSINNNSVLWAYRHDSSEAYRRPLARIMYGVR